MANVHDVAAYILESQGAMSPMNLQKLVYYAQAWSLVWDDRPLFEDPIEAWVHGPTVDALYLRHRGRYWIDTWAGDAGNLTREERETISAVLNSYGGLSTSQLADLIYQEDPWRDARHGIPAHDFGQINVETMRNFYSAQYGNQSKDLLVNARVRFKARVAKVLEEKGVSDWPPAPL